MRQEDRHRPHPAPTYSRISKRPALTFKETQLYLKITGSLPALSLSASQKRSRADHRVSLAARGSQTLSGRSCYQLLSTLQRWLPICDYWVAHNLDSGHPMLFSRFCRYLYSLVHVCRHRHTTYIIKNNNNKNLLKVPKVR